MQWYRREDRDKSVSQITIEVDQPKPVDLKFGMLMLGEKYHILRSNVWVAGSFGLDSDPGPYFMVRTDDYVEALKGKSFRLAHSFYRMQFGGVYALYVDFPSLDLPQVPSTPYVLFDMIRGIDMRDERERIVSGFKKLHMCFCSGDGPGEDHGMFWSGGSINAGAIVLALFFTLATFILLPFLETMRDRAEETIEVRQVDTLALEPPPPPILEPQPPRKEEEDTPLSPKPEMEKSKRRIPLQTMLNFNFGLGSPKGDFGLDFAIADARGGMADAVFALGEIDKNPMPLVRTQPIYPIQAKMRRIEGMVILQFVVNEDGSVRDIDVVESVPGNTFVSAAKNAVRNWKFNPGMKDGEAVAVRVQQKLTFRLE